MSRAGCLVLLWATVVNAAAPPSPDPLPPGAIARFGLARMVATARDSLIVTPDGKYLSAAASHQGTESNKPVKWFRLSDGRNESPPGNLPPGWTLRRVFPDGRRLLGKDDEHGLFDEGAKPILLIPASEGDRHFDRAGKVCVKVEVVQDRHELLVARLTLPGPLRWQRIAANATGFGNFVLAANGGRIAWKDNGNIHVYDLATNKLHTITLALHPTIDSHSIAISADGKTVAWMPPARVQFFEVVSGKQVADHSEHTPNYSPSFWDTQFTADGKTLVYRADNKWHLVPVGARGEVKTVTLSPSYEVVEFTLFPDGKRLAGRDEKGLIRVYDLHTGAHLDVHSRYPTFIGWQRIGRDTMLNWTEDGRLITWDLRNGRVVSDRRLKIDGFRERILRYEFDHDGSRVAAWTHDGCIIADVRSGKVLARVADADRIDSLHFVRGGGIIGLIAPREDETRRVRRLDIERPEVVLRTLGNDHSLLSPDGRFFLSASAWSARLLEVSTGKARWWGRLNRPEDPRGRETPTPQLAFDRAGRRAFVVRDIDTTVFDVLRGKKVAILEASGRCAISGSGRWVARADTYREEVAFWDVDSRYPAEPVFGVKLPPQTNDIALDEEGGRLITAHPGTHLVWDVRALRQRAPAPTDAALWEQLGEREASEAVEAMKTLVDDPRRAMRLLSRRLVPIPSVPATQVADLIKQLESDEFPQRQEAEAQLKRILTQAEGPMRAALAKAPLETRLRLKRLLRPLDNRHEDPDWLRQSRAIEVLERLASKDAIGLLTRLASGAAGAALTREASAALERLR